VPVLSLLDFKSESLGRRPSPPPGVTRQHQTRTGQVRGKTPTRGKCAAGTQSGTHASRHWFASGAKAGAV